MKSPTAYIIILPIMIVLAIILYFLTKPTAPCLQVPKPGWTTYCVSE
jgi:hypothetical protein